MASGAREAMAKARPVLDDMGSNVHDFGDAPGAGSMVKTINQLFCGVHLAVLGEAIALGKRAGLDPQRLLEVYGGSAAASWMMQDRGPRALQASPPSNSTIDIFVKDLSLVLDAGRDLKFPLAAGRSGPPDVPQPAARRARARSTTRICGKRIRPPQ